MGGFNGVFSAALKISAAEPRLGYNMSSHGCLLLLKASVVSAVSSEVTPGAARPFLATSHYIRLDTSSSRVAFCRRARSLGTRTGRKPCKRAANGKGY